MKQNLQSLFSLVTAAMNAVKNLFRIRRARASFLASAVSFAAVLFAAVVMTTEVQAQRGQLPDKGAANTVIGQQACSVVPGSTTTSNREVAIVIITGSTPSLLPVKPNNQVITLESLTADGVTNPSKVYGGTDPQITYAVTGLVRDNGITAEGELTELPILSARAVGENAGTYAITITNQNKIRIKEDSACHYNHASNSGGTVVFRNPGFVITPKEVTYTTNAADKVYDASADVPDNFAFGGTGFTAGNILNNDEVFPVGGAFSQAGVGTALTISGVTLGGADARNYTLSSASAFSGDITKRVVVYTSLVANKVWDGTAHPPGSAEPLDRDAEGIVTDSDIGTIYAEYGGGFDAGGPATDEHANLLCLRKGAYSRSGLGEGLLITGYELGARTGGDLTHTYVGGLEKGETRVRKACETGGIAANYELSILSVVRGDITQRVVTPPFPTAGKFEKVYDGTTTATTPASGLGEWGGHGYHNTSTSQTIALNLLRWNSPNAHDGRRVELEITGASAEFYTLGANTAWVNTVDAPVRITKKTLTLADVVLTKTYDGNDRLTDAVITATITGGVGGDQFTLRLKNPTDARYAGAGGGDSVAITDLDDADFELVAVGNADVRNYQLPSGSVTATGVIEKRALCISASGSGAAVPSGTELESPAFLHVVVAEPACPALPLGIDSAVAAANAENKIALTGSVAVGAADATTGIAEFTQGDLALDASDVANHNTSENYTLTFRAGEFLKTSKPVLQLTPVVPAALNGKLESLAAAIPANFAATVTLAEGSSFTDSDDASTVFFSANPLQVAGVADPVGDTQPGQYLFELVDSVSTTARGDEYEFVVDPAAVYTVTPPEVTELTVTPTGATSHNNGFAFANPPPVDTLLFDVTGLAQGDDKAVVFTGALGFGTSRFVLSTVNSEYITLTRGTLEIAPAFQSKYVIGEFVDGVELQILQPASNRLPAVQTAPAAPTSVTATASGYDGSPALNVSWVHDGTNVTEWDLRVAQIPGSGVAPDCSGASLKTDCTDVVAESPSALHLQLQNPATRSVLINKDAFVSAFDTAYAVYVFARNGPTVGAAATSSSVTVTTPPIPTDVTVTPSISGDQAIITVTWQYDGTANHAPLRFQVETNYKPGEVYPLITDEPLPPGIIDLADSPTAKKVILRGFAPGDAGRLRVRVATVERLSISDAEPGSARAGTIYTAANFAGPPTGLLATARTRGSEVGLRWEEPVDTGLNNDKTIPITGYSVQWRVKNANNAIGDNWGPDPGQMVSDGKRITHVVTGLAPETEYEFRVATQTALGVGEYSGNCDNCQFGQGRIAAATTAAGDDPTLRALTIHYGDADTEVTPTPEFARTTTAYAVEVPRATTSMELRMTATTASTTIRALPGTGITGAIIESGTGVLTFNFNISQQSGNIVDIQTQAVAATGGYRVTINRAVDAPGAPQNLAVAAGDSATELDVTWEAPSDNGGAAVSGYKVDWKLDSAADYDAADTATASGLTHTITGLTPGTAYTVRVAATNSAATGAAASGTGNTSSLSTTADLTDLQVDDENDNSITLDPDPFDSGMLAYTANIGAKIDGFQVTLTASPKASVEYAVSGGANNGDSEVAIADNTESAKIGVNNGETTTVTFTVTAEDSTTTRTYTLAVSRATAEPGKPVVTLTAAPLALEVAWTEPENTGSTDISRYNLRYRTAATTNPQANAGDWTPNRDGAAHVHSTRSDTITGLTAGTAYDVEVRALNNVNQGIGMWSDAQTATPLESNVATLTDVDFFDQDGDAIAAIDVAADISGDSAKRAFTYDVSPKVDGVFFTPSATDSSGATLKYTVDAGAKKTATHGTRIVDADKIALAYAMAKSIVITVTAADGSTDAAYTFRITRTETEPDAPAAPTLTRASGKADVAWVAPESNDADGITDYLVRWKLTSAAADVWTNPSGATGESAGGGDTAYEITGLTNGKEYAVQVAAVNKVDTSAFSPAANVRPLSSTAELMGLSVKDSDGSVEYALTPNFAVDEFTYAVTARAENGKEITLTPTGEVGQSIRISEVSTDSTYVPDDVNVGGTSDPIPLRAGDNIVTFLVSAPDSSRGQEYKLTATLLDAVPGKPTPVMVSSPQTQQLGVNWAAPGSDGGYVVSEYHVRWSTDGNTWTENTENSGTIGGDKTSFVITGLTDGIEYRVQVAATNSKGRGAWTDSVTGTPAVRQDNADLSSFAITGTQTVVITPGFDADVLTYTADAEFVDDTVQFAPVFATNGMVTLAGVPGENAPVALTGKSAQSVDIALQPGAAAVTLRLVLTAPDRSTMKTYTFAISRAAGAPGKPGALSALRVAAASAATGQLAVSWTWAGETNGAAITGFSVQHRAKVSGSGPVNDWTTTPVAGATATSLTIENLAAATADNTPPPYEVQFAAVNSVGTGEYSDIVDGRASGVPDAPAVTVTADDAQIQVEWNFADFTGGPDLTASAVRWQVADTGSGSPGAWQNVNGDSTAGQILANKDSNGALIPNYTITGLSNGTTYNVQVRAINSFAGNSFNDAAGLSAWSVTRSATPGRTLSDQATLSDLVLQDGADNVVALDPAQFVATTLTYTAAPAANIDEVFLTATTDANATLSYQVDSGAWASLSSGVEATGAITLQHAVARTIAVRVEAEDGSAVQTYSLVVTRAAGVPEAPAKPEAVAGAGEVTVTWTPPANNGAAVTQYHYRWSSDGDATNWESAGGANGVAIDANDITTKADDDLEFTIGSLTNGVAYVVQIAAKNSAGVGAFSDSSDAVTPKSDDASLIVELADQESNAIPVEKKSDTAFTATSRADATSVVITLRNSSGATFELFTSGDTNTALPLTSGKSEALTLAANADTEFVIDVTAQDGVKVVRHTLTITRPAAGLPGKPNAPTVTAATAGKSLDVTWTAPSADDGSVIDGGSVITDYKMRWAQKPKGAAEPAWQPKPSGESVGTSLSYTITDLAHSTTYLVQVAAVNKAVNDVNAVWSDSGEGRPTPAENVADIDNVSFGSTAGSVAIDPRFAKDVTSYKVTASFDATEVKLTPMYVDSTMTAMLTVGAAAAVPVESRTESAELSVDAGASVDLVLALTSSDGNVMKAYTFTLKRDAGAPGAPGEAPELTTSSTAANSLDVAWTWAGETNGAEVTGFRVRHQLAGAGQFQSNNMGALVSDGSTSEYTIGLLVSGSTYEVQYAAVNSAGTGAFSPTSKTVRASGAPDAPAVTLDAAPGELTATWTHADFTGGSNIASSNVRWRVKDTNADMGGDQSGDWQDADGNNDDGERVIGDGTTYKITGLTGGTAYEVQVRSVNAFAAAGTSVWSAIAEGTPTRQTLTITPKADSKTYGDADPALTYTHDSGFVSGESLTDVFTVTGGTVDIMFMRQSGEDAGEYNYVAVNPLPLTDAANLKYEVVIDPSNKFTINKKPLSYASTEADKTYDGTDAAPAFDNLGGSFTGVVVAGSINDTGKLALTGGTYDDPDGDARAKDVGTGKTLSGFTLGDTDANDVAKNYALGTVTVTGDITVLATTLTLAVSERVYDKTANAPVSGTSFDPLIVEVGGQKDDVTVDHSGAMYAADSPSTGDAAEDAGTDKAVDVSTVTIGGDDAGNYNITITGKGVVTKQAITITASGQGSGKPSDEVLMDLAQFDDFLTVTSGQFAGAPPNTDTFTDVLADASELTLPDCTSTTQAVQNRGGGTATFDVSGLMLTDAAAKNYDATFAGGTYTCIDPDRQQIIITPLELSSVYGDSIKAFTYTLAPDTSTTSEFFGAHNAMTPFFTDVPYQRKDSDTADVGNYGYELKTTLPYATNNPPFSDLYQFILASGDDEVQYEITRRPLNVASDFRLNRAYNGSDTVTDADIDGGALSNMSGDDEFAFKLKSDSDATYDATDAGTHKLSSIDATDFEVTAVQGNAGKPGNYVLTLPDPVQGVISAKEVTVTGAAVVSKVYDGNTALGASTVGTATVDTGVSGEEFTLSVTAGAYSGKDVDTASLEFTGAEFALTAADTEKASNYTLPDFTHTAEITKKPLAFDNPVLAKQYDGTNEIATAAIRGGPLVGLITDEFSSLRVANTTTSVYPQTGVGGDLVFATDVVIELTPTATVKPVNYQLPDLDVKGLIEPRVLTVAGGVVNKVYDGNGDLFDNDGDLLSGVEVTGTLGNTLSGEQVALVLKDGANRAALVGSNAGGATLSNFSVSDDIELVAVSGADIANYQLAADTIFSARINPKPVTIAQATLSKVYDGTTAVTAAAVLSGGAVSDTVGTDQLALQRNTAGSGVYQSENAGSYTGAGAITNDADLVELAVPSGNSVTLGNYALPANFQLEGEITAKELSITPADVAVFKPYDGTTGLGASKVAADLSQHGVLNRDRIDLVVQSADYSPNSAVGTYTLNVTFELAFESADGGQSKPENYSLPANVASLEDPVAEIRPRDLKVTVSQGAVSKVYDATTLAPSGLQLSLDAAGTEFGPITGEDIGVSQTIGAYNSPDVITAHFITVALTGSDVANYQVLNGGLEATITPKPVSAGRVGSAPISKVYDGTTTAPPGIAVTFNLADIEGPDRPGNVSPVVIAVGNYDSKDVDAANIALQFNASSSGTSIQSGNYEPNPKSIAATISEKALTVTAPVIRTDGGQPDAADLLARATVDGLIAPDTAATVLAGALAYGTAADGKTPIEQGSLALTAGAGANYSFTFVEGYYTVGDMFDVDGSSASGADGSDGIMLVRYLLGARGDAITEGGVTTANVDSVERALADAVAQQQTHGDVDGSGAPPNAADAIMIARFLLGVRGASLIQGMSDGGTTSGPGPGPGTVQANIETYLGLDVTPAPTQ